MAIRPIVYRKNVDDLERVLTVRWNGLMNGDTGAPIVLPNFRFVQCQLLNPLNSMTDAIFDVQAYLDVDNPVFHTLHSRRNWSGDTFEGFAGMDADGAPIRYVDSYAVGYRPRLTVTDVTASLDAVMLFVKTNA